MLIISISPIPQTRLGLGIRQAGVAMILALIMLVALTLSALALVRSVDTSNIIAGNLAFQQGATQYADIGTERAINWLQLNKGATLFADGIAGSGYSAIKRPDPTPGQTWDDYWTTVLTVVTPGVASVAQDPDTSNQVFYSIQRICSAPGDPSVAGQDCAVPPAAIVPCHTTPCLKRSSQQYYRITSRVVGPRNSVSYIQTIVAL